MSQTSINLPFITATAEGPKHIDTSMTRAKFEELCADLLERCRVPVENCLRDGKIKISEVDEVRGASASWVPLNPHLSSGPSPGFRPGHEPWTLT